MIVTATHLGFSRANLHHRGWKDCQIAKNLGAAPQRDALGVERWYRAAVIDVERQAHWRRIVKARPRHLMRIGKTMLSLKT